jgi:hypothetical protein
MNVLELAIYHINLFYVTVNSPPHFAMLSVSPYQLRKEGEIKSPDLCLGLYQLYDYLRTLRLN